MSYRFQSVPVIPVEILVLVLDEPLEFCGYKEEPFQTKRIRPFVVEVCVL